MWRSRHLDARLFAIAPAALVLFAPLGGTIAIAFLVIGIWLVFGRHKSSRYFDKRLALASFAVAGFSFVRQMVDQNFIMFGEAACRNYYLLLFALPFIPVGIVLVRNPVAMLSYGARFVLCLLIPFSLYWLVAENVRLGLDTNPLILTYIVALLACVARFPVKRDDRTGIIWFYLAMIPLAATGGRIAILFYVLAILIDLFKAPEVRLLPAKVRMGIMAAFAILLAATSMSSVMTARVDQTYGEVKTVLMGEHGEKPLRFSIWDAASSAFQSNPVFGAGQCSAMRILDESLSAKGIEQKFYHFHNMFADLLATLGFVGLALFGWFAYEVWRCVNRASVVKSYQVPILMLFSMIVFYGLTGSVISDDRMTAATLLVLGGIIKQGMMPRGRDI